jgi:nucleotidyltransferase substrate binding protein (TIGR01987 family)
MAELKLKSAQLKQALSSWEKALKAKFNDLNRDAAIQRFEFTYELFWKVLQIYLREQGLECASPNACFREMRKILNVPEKEIELCLQMLRDRNLSVHTYSEKPANTLYKKLKKYWKIINIISRKIS